MYIYTKIIEGKPVLYGTTAMVPAETDLPVKYFKNDWSVITDIGDYKFFYDNKHQIYGNDSTYGIPTDSDLAIYPYVEDVDGTLTPIISAIPGEPTVSIVVAPSNAWLPSGTSKTLTATTTPEGASVNWTCDQPLLTLNKTTGNEVIVTNASFDGGVTPQYVNATASYLGKTATGICTLSCSSNLVDLTVYVDSQETQPVAGAYEITYAEEEGQPVEHTVGVSFSVNEPGVTIASWTNPEDAGYTWEYIAPSTAAACRVTAAADTTSTATFTLSNDETVSVTLKVVAGL